ncbi:hypothetical protein LWI28_024041 [Acer negundo]|uniref:Uncharacterized protein n=1 Tax=Acer negundo TaxID=4023 RepID=A0AAD5JBB7_ACENE|nr:hypothetical protein LWI28_024041 [Acer negundo]
MVASWRDPRFKDSKSSEVMLDFSLCFSKSCQSSEIGSPASQTSPLNIPLISVWVHDLGCLRKVVRPCLRVSFITSFRLETEDLRKLQFNQQRQSRSDPSSSRVVSLSDQEAEEYLILVPEPLLPKRAVPQRLGYGTNSYLYCLSNPKTIIRGPIEARVRVLVGKELVLLVRVPPMEARVGTRQETRLTTRAKVRPGSKLFKNSGVEFLIVNRKGDQEISDSLTFNSCFGSLLSCSLPRTGIARQLGQIGARFFENILPIFGDKGQNDLSIYLQQPRKSRLGVPCCSDLLYT